MTQRNIDTSHLQLLHRLTYVKQPDRTPARTVIPKYCALSKYDNTLSLFKWFN